MSLSKNLDSFPKTSYNMLVFTDILDDLRLIAQLRIVFEAFNQFIVICKRNSQQIMKA